MVNLRSREDEEDNRVYSFVFDFREVCKFFYETRVKEKKSL